MRPDLSARILIAPMFAVLQTTCIALFMSIMVIFGGITQPLFAEEATKGSESPDKKITEVNESKTTRVPEEPNVIASSNQPPSNLLSFPRGVLEIATVGDVYSMTVEIAADGPRVSQGLMWRTELQDDQGMIFIFPEEGPRSFWMRNTLIYLDMLFLDANGVIVHIHENAIPKDETPVPSKFPARAVLEVRGGLASELGIQIGDKVRNLRPLEPVGATE